MRSTILIAMAALAACAPSGSENGSTEADNALAGAEMTLANAANALGDADAIEGATPAATWEYTTTSDPMSDEKTELACVKSTNSIYLDAPYEETGARLCLRNSPQFGRDVYVSLNKDGQILCQSYETCLIRIRFDKQPADPWSAIGPSDNSSDMVFIEDRENFERNVRTAETTNIQLEFYQNGMQTFTFHTAGLNWGESTK
jgi:hypothetical protein